MLFASGPTTTLGALEWKRIFPVLQTGAQSKLGQEAQRLSTLSEILKASVVELERDLPTPGVLFVLLRKTAGLPFCQEKLTSPQPQSL